MKKRTIAAATAVLLTLAIACPVMAATGSPRQHGSRGSSGHSSRSNATVRVINTMNGTDNTYNLQNTTGSVVKVTDIAESVNANNTFNAANAGKSYADKANQVMANGVTYAGNAYANAIYTAAAKAGNTTDFLNKLNPMMSTQIAARKPGFKAADYTLLSVFNMTASTAAQAQLGIGKTANINFDIPGIKAGGDYIVLAISGELGDLDALQQQLAAGTSEGALNVNGDILTARASADGKLNVDVSKYSTMIVLSRK